MRAGGDRHSNRRILTQPPTHPYHHHPTSPCACTLRERARLLLLQRLIRYKRYNRYTRLLLLQRLEEVSHADEEAQLEDLLEDVTGVTVEA